MGLRADGATSWPSRSSTTNGRRCTATAARRVCAKMARGTQDFEHDPRNERTQVRVNGELVPRDRAMVSVFDSGFVLGDGVWEGLRVHGGHPAFLDSHLDRLYDGAKAIMLDIGPPPGELTEGIS